MTPLQDATANPLPKLPTEMEASMTWPIQATSRPSPASSLASLPYRSSNPSLHRLFESTASISTSRPSSGSATPTASTVAGATVSPRQSGIGTPGSLRNLPPGVSDEYRALIQRAFVPHVAVLADEETEELIRGKGLEGGLLQLLRPYGESVPGKLTIRDSNGASKSYDDFGVRFVGINDGLGIPTMPGRNSGLQVDTSNGQRASSQSVRARRTGGDVAQVEELVDRHLQFSEFNTQGMVADYLNQDEQAAQGDSSYSPFYTLYLRRLLSGLPVVPHETFAHPVAGIIAISSRNSHPIEELRRLYNRQHDGDLRFPQWVENDFLRYYVLVHDEETGDIAKSNQTFDSMKRHFGLHCHLLRLKSQQIIPSDDDSVRLPTCEWMSATEELAEIRKRETTDDVTDPTPYLPESDVTAVKTFVRELVAQSVIPNMERAVATWNEQVLARRRGLSGRFMSLSKRWTPFGSSRSSSSASTSSSSNYDSLQGFYRPDAPEAQMRKLADYCFMLRDWKLALSTFDILRTDFNNDKAWRHYAGAAEMAAMSALMMTGPLPSKARTENLDSLIEAASYSYTDRQRSAAPYYALRTLALGMELLRLRGPSAAEDAARWGSKILDTGLVGAIGHALIAERVSACYAIRTGFGTYKFGSRRRKAALWGVLASEYWWRLDKALQAEKCLENALHLYGTLSEDGKGAAVALPLPDMQAFIDELRQQILGLRLTNRAFDRADGDAADGDDVDGIELLRAQQSLVVEEATESLDKSPRAHRKSLIGATASPIDVGPLSPRLERNKGEAEKRNDDQFETEGRRGFES